MRGSGRRNRPHLANPPGARWRPRLLVSAACLALLASACPGDDRRVPTPPGRPAPGGVIRLGYPEEPPSLNPLGPRSPAARDILRAVLPSFHVVTPELEYRPYLLASEPTVTTVGGRRMFVRFRLREDARWSDGRPITVDDVRFTWRVMRDGDLPVGVRDGFDRLDDVVRESAVAGTLVLSPPYAGWRDLFSAGRFVLPEAPHLDAVRDWEQGPPVAGGPFVIREWTRGRGVTLVRNPAFFGPRPLLEAIDVAFVPDATTALQLLEAGALDALAPMLGISWGRRLSRIRGVEASSAYGADLVHLVLNAGPDLDEAERRRIAESVDRDRFVEAVIRREGRRADTVLAPEQRGALPAWSAYGAGAPGPLRSTRELSLVYAESELLDLAARYIQAELRRAGGDVELIPLDADVFHDSWLPEREFDLALWHPRAGPEPWLPRWFGKDGGEVVSQIEERRLNRLLADLLEGGPGTAEALAEAQRTLAEVVPVLPLFQPKVTIGWRRDVAGLRANPTVDGPLWNAWAWSKARGAAG